MLDNLKVTLLTSARIPAQVKQQLLSILESLDLSKPEDEGRLADVVGQVQELLAMM